MAHRLLNVSVKFSNQKGDFSMKKYAVLALLLAGSLWAAPSQAGLVGLQLSDGVSTVTCWDGQACDTTAAAGAVTFSGAVGTWVVNVTTGLGYPTLGSPSALHMDLNSVNVSSLGGGTLTILLTQQDYFDPGLAGNIGFTGAIGGTTNGTLTYEKWVDDLNFSFFTNADSCSTLITGGTFGPGAFSGTSSGTALVGSANCDGGNNGPAASNSSGTGNGFYSMTDKVVITHTAGGVTSFDLENKQVPEPASMLLFGLGLAGLGFWGRKRLS